METRSNQVLVGSVVLGMLIAIALFVVWLTGLQGGKTKEYDIFFKQSVEGLAKGASVSFGGVPSGQIIDIELWRDNPEFKRVRVQLRNETPVLQGTTATILGSFTGPSSVVLDGAVKNAPEITDPGPAGRPVIPTKAGGIGALLNSAPQLLERLSTLTERLTELLSDNNQKSVTGILANTNRLTGSLADQTPELKLAIIQSRTTLKQAGDALEKIGTLSSSIDATVNGDGKPLIADLRRAVRSAQTSMETLNATLGDARPGLQAFAKTTLPEVGQLVRDLRVMSESLTAVAAKIDQGGATTLLGPGRLPDYKPQGGK